MARILAVVALLVAAVVVLVVIAGSFGGSDEGESQSPNRDGRPARVHSPPKEKTYTIRPGDTLSEVGERTGVSVDRIQRLNPELDPQSLLAGQEVRLR